MHGQIRNRDKWKEEKRLLENLSLGNPFFSCKRQSKKQKKSHLVTDTGGEFMPPSYALG